MQTCNNYINHLRLFILKIISKPCKHEVFQELNKRIWNTSEWKKPIQYAVIILLLYSCESVSVEAPNFLLSDSSIFQDENTAEAAVTGIYSEIMTGTSFASGGKQSITYLCGLSADNFTNYSFLADENQFHRNAINASNTTMEASIWNEAYKIIYTSNNILEGLATSSTIGQDTQQRLEGEAKFMRAFCYFYLVNLFGDIPLVTTTDYTTNSVVGNTSSIEVYQQIVKDLEDAKQYLPKDFSRYSELRVRPTHFAARAMLARTYLFMEEWKLAEEMATTLIENSSIFQLEDNLANVFLSTSREAIWQLTPVLGTLDTWEGYNYIITFTPPTGVALADRFLADFDPNDNRMTQWTEPISGESQTYVYPFKYKIQSGGGGNEYSVVLRLAEQYLIRAEARARKGDITGALLDLNALRRRSGLNDVVLNDENSLIQAILKERRFELFGEWGHRWLDLKRTGYASETLGDIKEDWQDTDTLYPIPQQEIEKNPNLLQNPGY